MAAEELDAGEYYLLVYPYPDQPLSAPVTFELDTECWTEPVIVDGPDGRRPVRPVLSCSFRGGSSASTSRGLALLLVAALLRRRRS